MRILQVTPGYPPTHGGVERHVAAVTRCLTELGHSVTVLVADGAPGRAPAPGDAGLIRVPARTVGPFLLTTGLRARLRALAAEHDVVHVHNYHSPLPVAVLATGLDVPVVVTPHFHGGGHSPLARVAHRGYAPLARRLLTRAAAAVCVSRAEADRFAAAVPALARRTSVIPNGARALPPGPPAAERDRLVLCVSRLEAYKRVDVLVRALARVPGPWRAVVVGEGPQAPALARLAASLGVADRLDLVGRVGDADLERLLRAAAVCVQPSAHEAFGLAVLDAVGAGARVVASDIPAHREVAGIARDGVDLWTPDAGEAHLAMLVDRALFGGMPGPAPAPLPTWAEAAAGLETVYVRAITQAWGS